MMLIVKHYVVHPASILSVTIVAISLLLQDTIGPGVTRWIRTPSSYFRSAFFPQSMQPNLTNIAHDPACVSMSDKFSSMTLMAGSTQYSDVQNSYWSAQASALTPSCIIQPVNTAELSAAIVHLKGMYVDQMLIRTRLNSSRQRGPRVRFAVKSGSHTPDAGFSSISDGALVDLSKFDSVAVDTTGTKVHIGVGSRWGDVQRKLEQHDLTVVGGRDGHVGVGGLVLGGGLSFLSPQHGMACDNVLSYEVVLANGTVVVATQNQHADLWRALKGGSGNFGIVTKLTAKAYAATKIWGGFVYWPAFQSKKVILELHKFAQPENFDPYASAPILGFGYMREMLGGRVGWRAAASTMMYAKPVAWPAVWRGFNTIQRVWSTVKIRSHRSLASELSSLAPNGLRRFQMTMTVKNDLETLNRFHEMYSTAGNELRHVRGLGHCMILQPLPTATMWSDSTNVFGLGNRNTSEPLIIVLFTQTWMLASDDEVMQRTTRRMVHEMQDFARSRGTLDPFIYLNYAGSDQDVFASYGADNENFLREVSYRYDPTGFWQQAKQGGFKLEPSSPSMLERLARMDA